MRAVLAAPLVTLVLGLSAVPAAAAGETSAEDEGFLRGAGQPTDDAALLDFFRRRTLTAEQQQRLAEAARDLGDESYRTRERASAYLVSAGYLARPFLQLALRDTDLEVSRRAGHCLDILERKSERSLTLAAARLLSARRPEGAVAVFLNYLPSAEEDVVEELLRDLAALAVRGQKVDPGLVKALADASPVRRSASAYVVGRYGVAPERHQVRRLLHDPDASVRLRAATGLLVARDKEAVPALLHLLQEPSRNILWPAEDTLRRLAGDQAPVASAGSTDPHERVQAREAWASWWRTHGPQLDLASLDLEDRPLGLTLIVAYDGYPGGGRVWEAGPDGKPRWQLNQLQGPIDAHVLSGNRLLVAEHSGNRVTERDFQGKVLWEHRVNGNPVACQRLPSGNTFVATYNEVREVNREGKVLYSYPVKGNIYAALKLRTGAIACVTSQGNLLELDEYGKEARSTPVGPIAGWATLEPLPGGGFLIPQQSNDRVVEFDPSGKALWECKVHHANGAVRLPNGNTLVCSNNDRTLTEVNRQGRVVWEQRLEGRPFRIRRR